MTDLTQDQRERRELIAQLFGAFGRTPTEANYAGYEAGLKLMQTPTLARVVGTWLEGLSELTDPSEARVPTAGKLWDLRRKLRKLPDPRPLELTPPPADKLDGWDVNANLLLLDYVTRGLLPKVVGMRGVPMPDGARYAPDSSYVDKNRCVSVGAQTVERTAILVKYKTAWAVDMREDRAEHGNLDGKKHWADCMALAEAEIDRYLGKQREAA